MSEKREHQYRPKRIEKVLSELDFSRMPPPPDIPLEGYPLVELATAWEVASKLGMKKEREALAQYLRKRVGDIGQKIISEHKSPSTPKKLSRLGETVRLWWLALSKKVRALLHKQSSNVKRG